MKRRRVSFGLWTTIGLASAYPAAAAVGRWTSIGPSNAEVRRIVVDPRTFDTVYSIADLRLFKSLDAGRSWRSINPSAGSDDDGVYSFAIDPSRPDTVYAGRSFGLVRSDDGGANWSELLVMGYVKEIAAAPSRAGTLYFHTGDVLFRSDDGGDHSAELAGPWSADAAISALAVDPERADTVYVAVHGAGVFKTQDGGRRWAFFGLGLPEAATQILVNPGRPSTVYAVTPSGALYATADITGVWLPIGPEGEAVRTVAVDSTDSSKVLAGAHGVYESSDGGKDWLLLAPLRAPVNAAVEIESLGAAGTIYAGTGFDGFFRSDDDGSSWADSSAGLPGVSTSALDASSTADVFAGGGFRPSRRAKRGSWVTSGPLGATSLAADGSGSTVYAGSGSCREDPHGPPSCSGALFRSVDGGETWTPVFDGAIFAVGVDPTHPATAYASVATGGFAGVIEGTIYKTVDGGAHWTDAGNPPAFVLTRLRIDPGQTDRLFATDSYEVFRSDDRGAHWVRLGTEFQPSRVFDLVGGSSGDSTAYLATSNGIFRSTSAGEIWDATTFDEDAETVALDPSDPQTVYVGTYLGVFRSVDAGDTWRPISLGLEGSPVYVLRLDPTGSILYAGTQNGVFELDLLQTRNVPTRPGSSAEGAPLR